MANERKSTDAFEATLKRELRSAVLSNAEDCPAPEVLAAYYDRSLSRGERARVVAHLTTCMRCQTMMASIARADEDGLAPASDGLLWITRVLAPVAMVGVVVAIAIGMRERRQPAPEVIAMASPAVSLRPQLAERAVTPPPEVAAREQPRAQAPKVPPPAGIGESTHSEIPTHHHNRASEKSAVPPSAGPTRLEEYSSATRINPPAESAAAIPASPPVSGNATAEVPSARAVVANSASSQAQGPTTVRAQIASGGAAAAIESSSGAAPAFLSGTVETATKASPSNWISSPDGTVRWQFGKDGAILRSGNSSPWLAMRSGVTTDLLAASAPANDVCWVVGKSGTIVRTLDGGAHWQLIRPPSRDNFAAIAAIDSNNATLTASNGQRFVTRDGGVTWSSP